MLDQSAPRVDQIEQFGRVRFPRCCKHNNFEILRHLTSAVVVVVMMVMMVMMMWAIQRPQVPFRS